MFALVQYLNKTDPVSLCRQQSTNFIIIFLSNFILTLATFPNGSLAQLSGDLEKEFKECYNVHSGNSHCYHHLEFFATKKSEAKSR